MSSTVTTRRTPTSKKRRIRSPHTGVVLIPPELSSRPDGSGGHPYWRARYRDPDTNKMVKVRLDPVAIRTADARREWAIKKSREIARRTVDLDQGAPRATGTALGDVLEKFFAAHSRLRDGTTAMYRRSADKLIAWAKANGVRTAEELTRGKLADFRVFVINERKRVRAVAGRRGELKESGEPRSGHTINGDLRKVGTILKHLVEVDLLPRLTETDLKRALKKVTVVTEQVDYLTRRECQALLEAALAHDAVTYRVTRAENAGLRALGSTPRFDPVAPLIAGLLLTGMRFAEAVNLRWGDVDLHIVDHDGRAVGEIRLRGENVKTRKARSVDLEVCPALRSLLLAMRSSVSDDDADTLVFGLSMPTAEAAFKRLHADYGAPDFSAQKLRRTCGTFLTNAPGIFGAASAFRSAAQLGHSVQVAERHYLGVLRGIPRDVRTLEAAMQIEDAMSTLVEHKHHGRDDSVRTGGL